MIFRGSLLRPRSEPSPPPRSAKFVVDEGAEEGYGHTVSEEFRRVGRPAAGAMASSLIGLSTLVGVLLLPWVAPPAVQGQTLIFDRFERAAGAPAGWTQLSALSSSATDTPTATPTSTPTDTPTMTPTGTPTDTPTSTPTGTLVPDGGSCDEPTDCVSGNCVDDTCCVDSSCAPGQSCNNPGRVGECSPDPIAPAPGLSQNGILIVLFLLVGIGGVAMRRRHSVRR